MGGIVSTSGVGKFGKLGVGVGFVSVWDPLCRNIPPLDLFQQKEMAVCFSRSHSSGVSGDTELFARGENRPSLSAEEKRLWGRSGS